MSDPFKIEHTPEHQRTDVSDRAAKVEQNAKEMAARYARVFLGSDDGRIVWNELRSRYGSNRPVFHLSSNGHFDPIAAALVEGERRLILAIERMLEVGAPGQALKQPTQ